MKGNTPDPRCVFALAGYFSIFAILAAELWMIGALLLLAVLCAIVLRVNIQGVFHKLRRLWQVLFMVAVLQSVFSAQGNVWLQIGPVPLLTSGGVTKGLVVLGRVSILIWSGSLFTLYSSRQLIQSMIQMRLPYEIAYMVSVGVRFVPLMGQELRDSLIALQLRGVVFEELKLKKRLQVYTYLLLPVVAGSLHNARALAMSMEMRGFRAYSKRTSFFVLEMRRGDYLLLAVVGVLMIITGAAGIFAGGMMR